MLREYAAELKNYNFY